MIAVVSSIFFVILLLHFAEEWIKPAQRSRIAMVLTVLLVLVAAFRPVGADKDSLVYEYNFNNIETDVEGIEWSFIVISRLLKTMLDDVHVVFLLYALMSIPLKVYALHKHTGYYFLPMLLMMSNTYLLHDLTQIRVSVVMSVYLYALWLVYEGSRRKAVLMILGATVIHTSALLLLPMMFLGTGVMSKRSKWLWGCVPIVAYAVFFIGGTMVASMDIPYVGDKIKAYQALSQLREMGDVSIISVTLLIRLAVFYYILLFCDTVRSHVPTMPLIIKSMAVSVFMLMLLSPLATIAFRTSELFSIVDVVLFAGIVFTIKPRLLGRVLVAVIAILLFGSNVFLQELISN